jgi:5'(3')-deoxyribonucleotidase
MRRLVIAIDVDGVIADFVGLVREELCLPDGWEPTCWDIAKDNAVIQIHGAKGARDLTDALYAAAFTCGAIPPYASEVAELKSIMTRHAPRAEFVFATSPMASNRTWTHDREAWLSAQGFEGVPVIHAGRKDLVDADVLLDDKPEHVTAFTLRRSNRAGVVRVRPWNEHAPRPRTPQVYYAESMLEFGTYLDNLFRIGETEHEKCEREAIGL